MITYHHQEGKKMKNFHCYLFLVVATILVIMYYSLLSNFTMNQHGLDKVYGASEGAKQWFATILVLSAFGVYGIYKVYKCIKEWSHFEVHVEDFKKKKWARIYKEENCYYCG